MNIKETESLITSNYNDLLFKSQYITGNTDKTYYATDLNKLRGAITNLESIPILLPEIENLKSSALFANLKDEDFFTSVENNNISSNIKDIRTGLLFLLRYNNQTQISPNGLYIRLPEIENFEDLSKTANDLKKAIEIPINDPNIGGHVKIQSAEAGSIWLIVSVGSFTAVNLIGAICWSAAVIRKKKAEAKIFEEHARTLSLKNDSIDIFVNAQREQLKNILESEAKEIENKHYSTNDPEVLNRIKLSITTVSDLIDKGTQILPSSDNTDTKKNFPDYSNLHLIESTIKMLQNGN